MAKQPLEGQAQIINAAKGLERIVEDEPPPRSNRANEKSSIRNGRPAKIRKISTKTSLGTLY